MSVLSFNDFDPLREVIVGSASNYLSHDRELSFELFFHENLYRSDWAYPRISQVHTTPGHQSQKVSLNQRYVDELIEDVENFSTVLESHGIRVRRPIDMPAEQGPISGLSWSAAPTPPLNIRDNTLIVGSTIIETSPAIRSRYLETRHMSHIFYEYFRDGAEWLTMPRPLLTDMSFDLSYAQDLHTTLGGPTEPILDQVPNHFDIGYEMMLDGAQCLRLGRDIIINVANENHLAGVSWLKRVLEPEYRIHEVWRLSDNHIDSMLACLRPGLFLARTEGVVERLPAPFNRWDAIIPPEPALGDFPIYNDDDLVLTSPYIDLNVLSLDRETVVVNEDSPGVRSILEQNGFTVIPIRHRHRRLFGGGFHCFTLDVTRIGSREDYTA